MDSVRELKEAFFLVESMLDACGKRKLVLRARRWLRRNAGFRPLTTEFRPAYESPVRVERCIERVYNGAFVVRVTHRDERIAKTFKTIEAARKFRDRMDMIRKQLNEQHRK